jgi:hypothetical protein
MGVPYKNQKGIDIYAALRKVPFPKRRYFCFKYPQFKQASTDFHYKDIDEFLKSCNRETEAGFKRWEHTDEYKQLMILALDAEATDDLVKAYEATRDKAVKGDDKAIRLMLTLQKEIAERCKQAEKFFSEDEKKDKDEEKSKDDDLI